MNRQGKQTTLKQKVVLGHGVAVTEMPDYFRDDCCTLACLGVSLSVMKYQDQKQIGKRRIYFILQLAYSPSSRDGKGVQDRKLEAETDAQVTEEHYLLLACPPWLVQSTFL